MILKILTLLHPIASLTEAIGFIYPPISMGQVSLADIKNKMMLLIGFTMKAFCAFIPDFGMTNSQKTIFCLAKK